MYSLRTPNAGDACTRPTELGGVDDGAHRVGHVVNQAQRRPRHARGSSRTIAVVVVVVAGGGGGGGEGGRERPTDRVALSNGVVREADEVGGAHAGGRAGRRGWRRLRRARGRLHPDDVATVCPLRLDIENDGNGNNDDDGGGGGDDREVASLED